MKTGRTSAVTWLVFGLGVAACKGNLHTGTEDLSDAGQGGSTGGLDTGGIRTGGIIGSGGSGGLPTGGIGTGGIMGGGGTGGVPIGGMVIGGSTGSGGMAVDAGSAGSMCNGLPLPANSGPVCPPFATMVVCISTCEPLQHPECAEACMRHACWDCGSTGWGLGAVDCNPICAAADAGRDAAGGIGGVAAGGMGTGGSSGGTAGQSATGAVTAGGVAGATVGGTGGTSSSNGCGTHDRFGPRLAVQTIGSAGGDPYDGPAIVERSASDKLILYFVLPGATGSTGGTGPDGGLPAGSQDIHATITGLDPMPLLAPGAKLWLSKNPAGNQESDVLMYGIAPWSISVRNRQGGDLLFGAARNQFDAAASPVRIGAVTPDCTAANVNPSGCTPGASVTYSSVEVEGDTPVVIHDSVPGTVTLGGIEYDVRATVQKLSAAGAVCSDYHSSDDSGVALDVRAKNLADLVAALEVGDPPSCGEGNDPDRSTYFSMTEVSVSTTYEGPVFYLGRDSYFPATYDFSIPGLSSETGSPPVLMIEGATPILSEPTVGQEFWLSFRNLDLQALREAEQGPVILAQSGSADAVPQLADLLGITVSAEATCTYAAPSLLWDAAFETNPPVRVKSGTTGTLDIGGRSYGAWVWGLDALTITIYPTQ